MPVTEDIERLAVARASSAEISRLAIEQGMSTLRQDGWAKAVMGLTSVEEIMRVVA
jgi:type IV pilus assembly protein PilB